MKCVSYTRTLPWKNHQGELTIAEQNQRIAAYLAEHKELDLLKKYSDRKNDEKARTAFDQMTNDGVERKVNQLKNVKNADNDSLFSFITVQQQAMNFRVCRGR